MKLINKFFLLTVLVLGFSSCEKLTEVSAIKDGNTGVSEPNPLNSGYSNNEVNSWIYDYMNVLYLWSSNMKTKPTTDLKVDPEAYFKSLLHKPGEIDRFSWIQEIEALEDGLQGIATSAGISYTPYLAEQNSKNVIFAVRYSIRNSPAEKAGIVRGDIINKVNGVQIDTLNYRTILSPQVLSLSFLEMTDAGFSQGKTVSVTKERVQNLPVHFNTILTTGNKKVGYLVYNQFITGVAVNGISDGRYDNELRQIFGNFKTAGINELVLDFRYNGGGAVTSSNILSSLIVKNLKPGTLMNTEIWGDNAKRYFNMVESNYTNYWLNEPNNLGSLDRVYVLTSGGTASASEIVINNLLPFMEVVIVGGNTYGKDVASTTIDTYDENTKKYKWKWGLQPIIYRTANALGEAKYGTPNGFTPTIRVNDNDIPFLPFGDPNETLLNAALKHIGGGEILAKSRIGKTQKLNSLNYNGGFDNNLLNISDMYDNVRKIK